MNNLQNLIDCPSDQTQTQIQTQTQNTYKNQTPAAEYFETLKSKYPGEFAKIADILVHFTNEEVYMFINYIFEYSTEDAYDTQYMLIPETKTKTILYGLNLFEDIYKLKIKNKQASGVLPKLDNVKYLYTIEHMPGPDGLEIGLKGVTAVYEVETGY